MVMRIPNIGPEPTPIVRTRHKISDIAWGVFWGLTAWTVIGFLAALFLIVVASA
jgi:hypothetical protein